MLGFSILVSLLALCLAQIPGEGPCAGQIYGDHIPDPKNCTKFYQCVSATEYHLNCPAGLHFDCVKKVCNWPLDAHCQLEGESCEGLEVTPPSIVAPCTSLDPETHGFPEDCTRYYYCFKGKPTIAKCPIGEFYSKDENACIEAAECPANATTTTTTTTTTPSGPVIIPPCSSLDPESLPNPKDCTKYTYCENGLPHIVQCAIGEYYSEAERVCIEAAECPATVTTTPLTTTTTGKPVIIAPCTSFDVETKEDPRDCTRYYYCSGGTPHLVQCYPGMYYSKEHQGCIVASECPAGGGGITTTTTTSKPTVPPITAPCESLDSEILEDPDDCTRYFYCYLGNPFIVQCPLGQYYSAVEESCVVTDQCPASVSTTTTTTTSTTTPSPIQPPCNSMDIESHPYQDDCTKFIYCFMGKPYLVDCTKGYFYDPDKHECVKADQCPSTATTTTSTTTTTTTTPSTTTSTTTTPSTTTSTTTPSTTTSTTTPSTTTSTTTTSTTTTTTTESPIRPPCTSMDIETHPIPEDCTQFVYCLMGNPYFVQCEKGYYYSAANNSCVQASQCPQNLSNQLL